MKNLFLKSLIALSVLLSMLACTKEGAQGPAGKDGNANVMYSDWITYAANFTDIATVKTMRIVVPQYTDNFVDSGGFYLAFVRWQNNVHLQLPFSKRFNSSSSPIVEMEAVGISFSDIGELRLSAGRQDGGNLQSEFTTLITTNILQVRYFLIRGTQNLRLGNGLSIRDYYKSKSYEEICALTGAPL